MSVIIKLKFIVAVDILGFLRISWKTLTSLLFILYGFYISDCCGLGCNLFMRIAISFQYHNTLLIVSCYRTVKQRE